MNRNISTTEVEDPIKDLDPRNSPGVDGLDSLFDKSFEAQLTPILKKVFADVLQRGPMPPSMSQVDNELILKKNQKEWSYRPFGL